MIVTGLGVGMSAPTLSSTAMSVIPPQRGGMAAGAVNTARQLGFALGIAALGTLFAARITSALSSRSLPHASSAGNAIAGGQSRVLLAHVPNAARATTDHLIHLSAVEGLRVTALAAGVLGVVGGAVAAVLIRPARPAARHAAKDNDPETRHTLTV